MSDSTAKQTDKDQRDGFYREPQTIAIKTARANQDIPDNPTEHRSDETWETITALAWRPAWSIRSRQGSLKALIQWWRELRS